MNKNGFVLIDCLISAFVITTAILPILYYVTIYTNNSISSFNYYQASVLAENELENLKGKINFESSNGVIDRNIVQSSTTEKNINGKNFNIKTEVFPQSDTNLLKVTTTVKWIEQEKSKEFELESLL